MKVLEFLDKVLGPALILMVLGLVGFTCYQVYNLKKVVDNDAAFMGCMLDTITKEVEVACDRLADKPTFEACQEAYLTSVPKGSDLNRFNLIIQNCDAATKEKL